jgi:hypothetical protein
MSALEIPPRVFSTATSFFSSPHFSPSPASSPALETKVTDVAVSALP